MLLIQELLRKDFEAGINHIKNDLHVDVKEKDNRIHFKYSMIDSPMGDAIVQECRGLILDKRDFKVVSLFAKKFFNHGEGHAAKIDVNTATVFEKCDGCLVSDARLDLWDGGTISIGEIVNKKLKPTLLGVNEKGKLVPCEILNHFNNGTKRNWFKVKVTKNKNGMISNGYLKITGNHQVVINGEYKEISEAKIGDILNSYEEGYSKEAIHFIKSSLLGDGSVCYSPGKKVKTCNFQESHTSKNQDYINYIKECLSENLINDYSATNNYSTVPIIHISTFYSHNLTELRNEWYTESKDKKATKKLPENLNWIDDFAVAKWYMDDGSLTKNKKQKDRACFSTNSFTLEEVKRLGDYLSKKYNITYGHTKDSYHKNYDDDRGYSLLINAGKPNRISDIDNFWKSITPHIPDCMRYKIPTEYHNIPHTPYAKCKKEKRLIESEIISIKQIDERDRREFPSGACGYDIETSTHNYFAKGVLMHNSCTPLYFYNNEWHVHTLGTIDAEGPVNELFGGTFAQLFWSTVDIDLDMLDKKNCYTFELVTKYNRIVTRYYKDEAVLLSIRNLETLQEYPQSDKIYNDVVKACTNVRRPKMVPISGDLESVVQMAKDLGMGKDLEEGYVVCDSNFNRVKIKNPSYLAIARIKDSSVNSKAGFMQLVLAGEESEFLVHFPEYSEDIFKLKSRFDKIVEEAKELYKNIKDIKSQKDFALEIQKSGTPFYSFLYGMRAGKYDNLKRAICQNADPRKVLDWIEG